MIGIDTNVLVRFLTQDDAEQSARATTAFSTLTPESPGHLSTVALVETYWVLRKAYKRSATEILGVFEDLMATGQILVQDSDQVKEAITLAYTGADFADALICAANSARGCRTTWSFDTAAQERLGFTEPS